MKKFEDFIKIKEVSKITGYSIFAIRQFANKGKLKVYRTSAFADMRFKRSDIEQFMQSGSSARTKRQGPAKKGSNGKPARV